MELIDVQPQDFMFLFGITLTNLEKLILILDHMEFSYDSSIPEHVKAKTYLEEEFYPTISKAMESIKDGVEPDGKRIRF